MRYLMAMLMTLALPLLAACTGPKGDTGPMGPSGAGTPVYYYNNNFDSGGVSEWKTYQPISAGSIQTFLDTQVFVSPSQSLGISFTSDTGQDALAYLSLPIHPDLDCWVDFDWYMQDVTAGGFEFFETLGGSRKKVVIGFYTAQLYLVQGASQVVVGPRPSSNTWHHVTIKVEGGTGLASYWMDGMTLGTNYQTDESIQGAPPSGYLIGIANQAGADSSTHLDNLRCYHY